MLFQKKFGDLVCAVDFHHTGHIEMFNSTLSKYCSKEHYYKYNAMDARVGLAALNFNENVNRPLISNPDNA